MALNVKTKTKDGANDKYGPSISTSIHGYNDTDEVFKPVKVNDNGKLETASTYSVFETGIVAPGASADGYDVKTTGGLFTTVETSFRTIITNNDTSESIIVYLNIDGVNPITISSLSTFEIMNYAITNMFIDTESGHTGTVEIIMFG